MATSRIPPSKPSGLAGRSTAPPRDSAVRTKPAPQGLDLAAAAPRPPQIAYINDRLEGAVGRSDSAQIIASLARTPGESLNTVLDALDIDKLLDEVEDHFWPLPQYRTQLLEVLTRDRVADINVPNRAKIIGALQTGRTNTRAEAAIRDLFLATSGAELTELKNRVDSGGDYHDLQQLLHHDIDKSGIRQTILKHFSAQAKAQPSAGTKLLSDIDDTLYASLNDGRYDKGTIYPGVLAFHQAIAAPPGEGQSNLTFLSARPQDRMGLLESQWTQKSLTKKGVGEHVVLSGDLASLKSYDKMADKKMDNFQQYEELFGEYNFVFVGDSGQGDATLGQNLRREHADSVPLVLIHDLGKPGVNAEARQAAQAKGIVYFDSYVGAALATHQAGLIDDVGLQDVINASRPRLGALSDRTAALLRKDIQAADKALRALAP